MIAICKTHKIAAIADFALGDDGLHCTTALLEDSFSPSDGQLKALEALKPKTVFSVGLLTYTKPK